MSGGRGGTLKPPRPFGHWHLKPARLCLFRHSPRVEEQRTIQCVPNGPEGVRATAWSGWWEGHVSLGAFRSGPASGRARAPVVVREMDRQPVGRRPGAHPSCRNHFAGVAEPGRHRPAGRHPRHPRGAELCDAGPRSTARDEAYLVSWVRSEVELVVDPKAVDRRLPGSRGRMRRGGPPGGIGCRQPPAAKPGERRGARWERTVTIGSQPRRPTIVLADPNVVRASTPEIRPGGGHRLRAGSTSARPTASKVNGRPRCGEHELIDGDEISFGKHEHALRSQLTHRTLSSPAPVVALKPGQV